MERAPRTGQLADGGSVRVGAARGGRPGGGFSGHTRYSRAAGGMTLFEDELVDLSADWGEANACLIWDDVGVRECFRTEAEMDKRITELEKRPGLGTTASVQASQCSGSVRLYDGLLYTGQVLELRDRLQWISLSAYGFSNKTTSFKIGSCASYFADFDWGGGSWYSTSSTEAWDMA